MFNTAGKLVIAAIVFMIAASLVIVNMNRLLAGGACLLVELVPAAEDLRIFGGMPPDVYVAKNGGYRFLPWILQRDLDFFSNNTCCSMYYHATCSYYMLYKFNFIDKTAPYCMDPALGVPKEVELSPEQKEWLFDNLRADYYINVSFGTKDVNRITKNTITHISIFLKDDVFYWEKVLEKLFVDKKHIMEESDAFEVIKKYRISRFNGYLVEDLRRYSNSELFKAAIEAMNRLNKDYFPAGNSFALEDTEQLKQHFCREFSTMSEGMGALQALFHSGTDAGSIRKDLEFLISDPKVIFMAGAEPVTWKDLAAWAENN